jgi:hypothetical protein
MRVKVKTGMLAFMIRVLQAPPTSMSDHAILFNLGIDQDLFEQLLEVNRWPTKYRAQVLNDWDEDEAPIYDAHFVEAIKRVREETGVFGMACVRKWEER